MRAVTWNGCTAAALLPVLSLGYVPNVFFLRTRCVQASARTTTTRPRQVAAPPDLRYFYQNHISAIVRVVKTADVGNNNDNDYWRAVWDGSAVKTWSEDSSEVSLSERKSLWRANELKSEVQKCEMKRAKRRKSERAKDSCEIEVISFV